MTHSLTKFVPSPNAEIQTYQITCCGNQQQPEKKEKTRRASPLDPALSTTLIPRPPDLGLRIRDRPRRHKLLRHRRMPVPRSPMQRRESILRRAAALCQAHSLSAQVRSAPPTPVTLCITKPRKGETSDERDNSLPAKPRCHEKLGLDWQTFVVMERVPEDSSDS